MHNKMILIGNGYDIYRSKQTSYNDFKKWVEDKIQDKMKCLYDYLVMLESKTSEQDIQDIIDNYGVNFIDLPYDEFKKYNEYFDLDLSIFKKDVRYLDLLTKLILKTDLNFLFDEYKTNDEISVLIFFYILISKEFCTSNRIYWGDIEGLFKKVYINNNPNTGESYYGHEIVNYFITNYDNFVNIFTNQFIKEKEKNKSSFTPIENAIVNISKKDKVNIICLNYIYPISNDCSDSIIMFHGEGENAIFGSTIHREPRKYGYNKIDKLYKRLNISSRENRLDLTSINEIYTLGFSFSENDDYIIHSILNDNEEICIYIIEFPRGEKYVQEQIDSLYSCITRFDKGFELIEKMIIRDQIKIISHTEFIDISKEIY